MIKCIVFDMDDTLYDEMCYCKSGFKAVSEHLSKTQGLPASSIYDALWEQFEAKNQGGVFNAALEKLGIAFDSDFIQSLVQIYRNHNPDIALPADSREILEKLHRKYILALLTDGFMPAQKLKVEALDIEKYFKSIIYTELLGREFWKPSTVGFEKILNDLNLNAEECVYVADNLSKDFIGPNKLGFTTVQILRPNRVHNQKSETVEAEPDYVINKISEIENLLNEIS